MHKGISIAAMVAMLAQGPASAVPPEQRQQQGSQSALCRQPAALPRLAPEDQNQYDEQRLPRPVPTLRSAAKTGDDSAASAPPPPPVSSPAYAGSAAEDGEVIVTARRIEEPMMDSPVAVTAVGSEELADASADKRSTTEAKVKPSADGYDAEADGDRPDIMPPPPRRRSPQPQPGQLTAGEHDDLLNPELYADYVRRSDLAQWIPGLPSLDTQRVLTVTVKDEAGRPVPFATVELACADGSRLSLSTMADGTVTFFPDLDRLGRKVRLRTGAEDWRDVTLASRRGGQRVDFTVERQAPSVRKLDLMLAIDTTGSMGDEIRYLQSELAAILDALRARHRGLDLRVGFVFYRDQGDDYVTATVPLGHDFAASQGELRQRWAGGGGDYPEAMDQAMIRAAGQAWRPDAVKSLLLVADAPPHDENVALTWRAAEHLRAKRVHIVPVAASGVADKAEYVMRAMAAATQSRYTFLTDDSGIGNAHAAPAIDCYLVTRLDRLLTRVIDSQLSGRRIEPEDQEVIRQVGDYNNGRCVIPRGHFQQS
jgi:von Willebrand factor type A domain